MLTPLDDSLFHQLPTTFDHVGTSDPRFFDRYWFAAYDREGAGALQVTIGVYSNMDVVDAGAVLVRDGRQHNLRASRSLRPRFEPVCGPIGVEVVEPLRRFRISVAEGDHTFSGTLDWTGTMAVEEERPHFDRIRGRVTEDYQRFDQIGSCSGRLRVDGVEWPITDWWACRDHSWGIRPGMGVPEPVTGPAAHDARRFLFCFLFFSTPDLAGHVQIAERDGRRTYLTGLLRPVAGGADREVAGADLDVRMHEGTSRFTTVTLAAAMAGGGSVTIRAEAVGPSIAMPGLGYSGGFDDGRGLGVWRGTDHVEHEVWGVADPVDVVRADGSVDRPVHRIQPVAVTVEGTGSGAPGTGSMTMLVRGG